MISATERRVTAFTGTWVSSAVQFEVIHRIILCDLKKAPNKKGARAHQIYHTCEHACEHALSINWISWKFSWRVVNIISVVV